jgi:hypothetical protein
MHPLHSMFLLSVHIHAPPRNRSQTKHLLLHQYWQIKVWICSSAY